MTPEWLIYAVGGGYGHATRAALVQEAFAAAGIKSRAIIRKGSDPFGRLGAQASRRALSAGGYGLLVDTFPGGLDGELTPDLLARFEVRVLLARYNTVPAPRGAYDRIWEPYPVSDSEWPKPLPGAVPLGHLVRGGVPRLGASSSRDLAVIDPGGRVDAAFAARLAALARRSGYAARICREVRSARKVLFIGAGYNTFYEYAAQDADVRFLPLERRYDDQHWRARRHGRAVSSPDDLAAWLAAPAPPAPVPVRPGRDALIRAVQEVS